ncbi:hypothetical protein BgiMline_005668 [Biomphalaria glabrata]|nr:hypothetical protein BgiMline_003671 [Biomphalaria glabrata]
MGVDSVGTLDHQDVKSRVKAVILFYHDTILVPSKHGIRNGHSNSRDANEGTESYSLTVMSTSHEKICWNIPKTTGQILAYVGRPQEKHQIRKTFQLMTRHVGRAGNEKADFLAKLGSKLDQPEEARAIICEWARDK